MQSDETPTAVSFDLCQLVLGKVRVSGRVHPKVGIG